MGGAPLAASSAGRARARRRAAAALWLAAPLLLTLIPTRWIEAGPTLCLIRRVMGRPCPGCGMTRALSRLAHGDPLAAWRYNPRVVVVAPLLALWWGRRALALGQAEAGALTRRSGGTESEG